MSCFPRGSKVLLSDLSDKNIEDIQKGEYIAGYDFDTGQIISVKVINITTHIDEDIYKFNNKLIIAGEHPICIDKDLRHFRKAKFLKASDRLFNYEGIYETIEIIEKLAQDEVFDIEVERPHNYFVEGILVHNKEVRPCCPAPFSLYINSPSGVVNINAGEEFIFSGHQCFSWDCQFGIILCGGHSYAGEWRGINDVTYKPITMSSVIYSLLSEYTGKFDPGPQGYLCPCNSATDPQFSRNCSGSDGGSFNIRYKTYCSQQSTYYSATRLINVSGSLKGARAGKGRVG